MDVAGSFVATVTPPSYSLGAQEAKRATIAQVQIPAPKAGSNSQQSAGLLDQRGSTQGENSLLNAQVLGIRQAQNTAGAVNANLSAINEDYKKEQNKALEQNNPNNKNTPISQDNSSNTQELNAKKALSEQQIAQSFNNLIGKYAQSSGPINNGSSNAINKKELSAGAVFLKDNKDSQKQKGQIIANRYNSISPKNNMGNAINVSM